MKIVLLAGLALVAGCATASHTEREALLAKPIDCAVANDDIAAIEAALPSSGERARSALQSVTPVGVVTGAVSGSYDERAAVLTGRTGDDLVARINEIRIKCGIEAPTESDPP